MPYSTLTSKHSITVQKQTETTGSGMGVKRTWTTVKSNVKCLIQPMKQEQRITFRQAGIEGTHIVYLREKPNPEFDETNRFIFDGDIYQFRGLIDNDESAHVPRIQVHQMVLFKDSRDNRSNN